MADYHLYRMPKTARGDSALDKTQLAELDSLAAAARMDDKTVYLAGPHDNAEQKAAIKAARSRLIAKGVAATRITTSKPAGEPLAPAGPTTY